MDETLITEAQTDAQTAQTAPPDGNAAQPAAASDTPGSAASASTSSPTSAPAPASSPAPDPAAMPDAAAPAATGAPLDQAATQAAAATPDDGGLMAMAIDGGPVVWMIGALSVLTLALVLWKIWRLALLGAWSGGARAQRAVALWAEARDQEALEQVANRRTCRAVLTGAAMRARLDPALDPGGAQEETARVARGLLVRARAGLRPLELIATIAPLLGLLGTVLGMITAFQTLQEAGSRADPAALAGGIWEALLTTAAGMAVAIPASMALTWFESVADRLRHEMEDYATRIFLRPAAQPEVHTPDSALAAE